MYINYLVTESGQNSSDITLYADDTILYTGSDSIEKAGETNQLSVNILHTWCTMNR